MEFAIQKSCYFDIYQIEVIPYASVAWWVFITIHYLLPVYRRPVYRLSSQCCWIYEDSSAPWVSVLPDHPGTNRRPMAKAITFTENRLNLKLTGMHFHADTFQQRGMSSIIFFVSNPKYSLLMSCNMSSRASVNMKLRPGQMLHEPWKTAYTLELITSQQPANKSDSEMSGTYKSKLLKILQFYEFAYAWKKVSFVHHNSLFHL